MKKHLIVLMLTVAFATAQAAPADDKMEDGKTKKAKKKKKGDKMDKDKMDKMDKQM